MAPDLASEFSSDWPAAVRIRGQSYASDGRVDIFESSAGHLVASVRGTELYEVFMAYHGADVWAVGCTCPAYEKFGPCKHVWAVIVEASRRDLAIARPATRRATNETWDIEESGIVSTAYLQPVADEDGYDDGDDDWSTDELAMLIDGLARDPALAELLALHGTTQRAPERRGPSPWNERLAHIASLSRFAHDPEPTDDVLIEYVLDSSVARFGNVTAIRATVRRRKQNGAWGVAKPVGGRVLRDLHPDPDDARILSLLFGTGDSFDPYSYSPFAQPGRSDVPETQLDIVLPLLCATGRFRHEDTMGERSEPLVWDDGEPWTFALDVSIEDDGGALCTGRLERGAERIALDDVRLVRDPPGVFLTANTLATFDARGGGAWLTSLTRDGPLGVPAEARDALARALVERAGHAPVTMPDLPTVEPGTPQPHLDVFRSGRSKKLSCDLTFRYGSENVRPDDARAALWRSDEPPVRRDLEAERSAAERFFALGGERPSQTSTGFGQLTERNLPVVVAALLDEGWRVTGERIPYRRAGGMSLSVRSGVDWFDLEGGLDFDGQVAPLPALIEAARANDSSVRLDDGSVGLLPERWLEQWGFLGDLGDVDDGRVRVERSSGLLLDALLSARDAEVHADASFSRLRRAVARFDGIRPGRTPRGFDGELRDYQLEALGWFAFLRDLGLGGCLADDMGLGKTVQVLALLASRRRVRQPRTSLVVAPRSLVFHWISEAQRFAPRLRVLDYTGPQRKEHAAQLDQYDLVVTTYGVLRRDVLALAEQAFDYVVLDEAQAAKNARSQTAKAVRLLHGEHRLALSGTPIENNLDELWSMFEFLQPGMLGRASSFKALVSGEGDAADRDAVARVVRPFILRRTKEEVLTDLPAKTDQTLWCDLTGRQKKDYTEIRDHYRSSLLARAETSDLGQMKMHVLEALLRLRQVCCHPGLVDPELSGEPSAKLDVLIPLVEEVVAARHKVLIFSQFTSLLAIVRDRLDTAGITYESLDGRTRNRQARVERFQEDPDCPVFLISLKAGGLGLNLTAADYVFLLDPWWNPAVERQAIDRSHRIGQTRPVMAYRLICRGTVEERVLELQQSKRELADAILGESSTVLKTLTRDDLELLLS